MVSSNVSQVIAGVTTTTLLTSLGVEYDSKSKGSKVVALSMKCLQAYLTSYFLNPLPGSSLLALPLVVSPLVKEFLENVNINVPEWVEQMLGNCSPEKIKLMLLDGCSKLEIAYKLINLTISILILAANFSLVTTVVGGFALAALTSLTMKDSAAVAANLAPQQQSLLHEEGQRATQELPLATPV